MIKDFKKGKKYMEITAIALTSICLFAACSNKAELPKASYSYGPEVGLASGNVDLSSDTPDINISDIKSPVGEDIDYLSGVVVMNEDTYEDLQIWADASTIDIFTPGDYKVIYTFNYGDKSFSKEVKVTIYEPEENEPELSESDVDSSNSSNTDETETKATSNNEKKTTGNTPTSTTKSEVSSDKGSTSEKETTSSNNEVNTSPIATSKPIETTKPVETSKPVVTTKPTTTTKATSSTKPTSGQTTTKKDKTTREIITTKGNQTTENKHIANYTIELLSGKTITVKNTTSKYIVSTRTDTSVVTKNGSKYKVSKLIIRYNTGAEQILEIVEEKIG